jgi:hypothetical protein
MFPRKDQYGKMPNHIPPMLGNPYISPTKPSGIKYRNIDE